MNHLHLLTAVMLGGATALLAAAGNSGFYVPRTNAPAVRTIVIDTNRTPARVVELPANVRYEPDVSFLPDGRPEKADLYFPAAMPQGGRLPAVVVIHGGGFNDGDKARPREINFATNLVANGCVVMSINYKLRKRQGEVTWPQPVLDAKTAIRWLRKNAEPLGIDPERIGAMGGSAGGNLSAMLALTGPEDGFDENEPYGEFSSRVNCGVDFYGAVKLMEYHDMKMFAKTRAEAPEFYEKASPVNYASPGDAPMLIIHGTKDETVPLAQSAALVAALQRAGVEHEFVILTNAAHTFHLMPTQKDLRPTVFNFLDRHLQGPHDRETSRTKIQP